MKINKIIIVLSLMLILVSQVYAIGVAPASKEFLLDKNSFEYDLKITNSQKLDGNFKLQVVGELADYVTLSKDSVDFSSSKEFEIIKVRFNIRDTKLLGGGEHVSRIIVQHEEVGDGQITALLGIASKLTVTVPYDGSAIEAELLAPNFRENVEGNFAVEVFNKGNQDAQDCRAIVEVFTSLNKKVASLISEKRKVKAKVEERFLLAWKPNVPMGNYLVKGSAVCTGTEESNDEKAITVGSPTLDILSFTADQFRLGQINKFDLIISSSWGEAIQDVFAEVNLLKDEKQVLSTKSETIDIDPESKAALPIYINTQDISVGDYMLIVTLKYLDQEVSEAFDANINIDKININSLTGNVIGQATKTGSEGGGLGLLEKVDLLILLIVIMLVVNGLLFYKLLKKKKQE